MSENKKKKNILIFILNKNQYGLYLISAACNI